MAASEAEAWLEPRIRDEKKGNARGEMCADSVKPDTLSSPVSWVVSVLLPHPDPGWLWAWWTERLERYTNVWYRHLLYFVATQTFLQSLWRIFTIWTYSSIKKLIVISYHILKSQTWLYFSYFVSIRIHIKSTFVVGWSLKIFSFNL